MTAVALKPWAPRHRIGPDENGSTLYTKRTADGKKVPWEDEEQWQIEESLSKGLLSLSAQHPHQRELRKEMIRKCPGLDTGLGKYNVQVSPYQSKLVLKDKSICYTPIGAIEAFLGRTPYWSVWQHRKAYSSKESANTAVTPPS